MKEIKMFMAYASEDEEYKVQLSKHLSALKEEGYISEWTAGEILPGANVMSDLRKRMSRCDIIALLLSADFVGSDDGIELEEMAFALKAKKGTRLVPIKIRACMLSDAYAQFSMLPDQSKPVDDPAWGSRDNAYMNIAEGLKKLALSIRDEEARGVREKVKQTIRQTTAAPSQPISSTGSGKSSSNKKPLLIAIGILAALLIGLAGFIFINRDHVNTKDEVAKDQDPVEIVEDVKTTTEDEPKVIISETPVDATEIDENATDADAYDSAKAQNTITAFSTYLQQFPDGKYMAEANSFIKKLKNDSIANVADNLAKKHDTEWDNAIKNNDLFSFQKYVHNYPEGSHVVAANEKIAELKVAERDNETWKKAVTTNTVSDYLRYIKEYSPGLHRDEAIAAIKPLLKKQGWAYYGKLNADKRMNNSRYFDLFEGEKDGNPKVGDLIQVQKGINIRRGPDPNNATIESLRKDKVAMITDIKPGVWVKINY